MSAFAAPRNEEFMKYHASSKPWLALSLGALATLSAGCAGANTGTAFESPVLQNQETRPATQSQQKLYVTDVNGSVSVFSVGKKPQLLRTITDGVPRPYGVWVDENGILYVVNLANDSGEASLSEYKPGAFSPFFQITSGVLNFGVVAVNDSGNVYLSGLASSYEVSYVNVYPPGAYTPADAPGPDGTCALSIGELDLRSQRQSPRGCRSAAEKIYLRLAVGVRFSAIY